MNKENVMFNELTFIESIQKNDIPFLGGSPYLPESMPWPCDSNGNPLLHLASLPAEFIVTHLPSLDINQKLVISIFSPYSRDDEYIDKAMNEGGKIIAYEPTKHSRNEHQNPITHSCQIFANSNPGNDSEENGVAKIGGIPAWLQEEDNSGLTYVLQINNSRLNKAIPTHKGILVGGIGYLLLKSKITNQDTSAGIFVIQTT